MSDEELPPPLLGGGDESSINATAAVAADDDRPLNWSGIASIIVFYLAVLMVGVWAGWKQKRSGAGTDSETVMVAGRNIGLWVGVLTMGGAFNPNTFPDKLISLHSMQLKCVKVRYNRR